MSRSFPRSVIALGVTALLLAGCSSGRSEPESGGTDAATSPSSGAFTVSRVEEATDPSDDEVAMKPSTVHAESSWDTPRYSLQWPEFDSSEALSAAVARLSTHGKEQYLENAAGAERADYTMVWEPALETSGLQGVRMVSTEQGADTHTESTTLYGSGDREWSSAELIAPSRKQDLTRRVISAVQEFTGDDFDPGEDPKGLYQDVTFTRSGTMVIRLGKGVITPMSEGVLQITVPDPVRYLSENGSATRDAAMTPGTSPELYPSQPVSPSPSSGKNTATPREKVDCTRKKCIALTFDDGPGPYTSEVLDALEEKNAKASFFMLGPAVTSQPDVVRRMHSLGMDLGNHTWSHSQFSLMSPEQVSSEITRQADAVEKVTGSKPMGVRPPYGDYTPQSPHVGYPFVLWDVDTEDWKDRNADLVTRRAVDGAHPGAVILMHDIHPTTAKAVPRIVDELQSRGYTLVTVSDLVGDMDPERAYSSGRAPR